MIKIDITIPDELIPILKSPELRNLFILARDKIIFYKDEGKRVYLSRENMLNALDYFILHKIIKKIDRDKYQFIYEKKN